MWKQLKQLGRQSAIYGLGNVGISLLSFLLVPLYTHSISTGEFGVYSLMLILYSVLSLVADCGFTNSIARYYFDDELGTPALKGITWYRQGLISTAMAISAAISVLLSLVCYVSANLLARNLFGQPSFSGYIRIVAVTLLFRGLTAAPMIYLRVTERPLTYTTLTFLQIFLFLASNIVFVAVLKLGVNGILYGLLTSTVVYAVLLIGAIARDLKPRLEKAVAKELFRFGLPFLPVLLLTWVIDFSDRYLLNHYTTISEVGVYSLGYKFGQVMMFVVTAFTLGWVPIRFKMLALNDAKIVYGRIATFYLAGTGLVLLILTSFAREIIILSSPEAFHSASTYIAPVAFGYLLYGLFVVALTGVGVAKRSASLPFVMLVAAAINIALNILFIPRVGAIAAAYATIVSYAVMVAGGLYFSQRLYPIVYEYGKCAALLAAMTALAVVITWGSKSALTFNIAIKLIALGSYVWFVFWVGVLNAAELRKVLELISRRSPRSVRAGLDSYVKRRFEASESSGVEVTCP